MFMVIGVVNVHLFRTDLNNSLPLGSYLGKNYWTLYSVSVE